MSEHVSQDEHATGTPINFITAGFSKIKPIQQCGDFMFRSCENIE
jgi:hypothetical protein